MSALDEFSLPTRSWFEATFGAPTPPQEQGWPRIAEGNHTLILAPTGSGKTLSAFLWALDRVMHEPVPDDESRTRVLYLSPLRALAVDIEKNLRAPLKGIQLAAERLGHSIHVPTVGMRTGDTPADQRRQLVRRPPDVLITTPESLYLMLTSKARESLASVRHVIIDEIHAVAATKRGSHLSLSLERLVEVADEPPQRIGLSATQRPLEEIARFLGGYDQGRPRPVTVVDAGVRKELDIEVVVPVEDMGRLGEIVEEPVSGPLAAGPVRRSIWPSMHPRLLQLVDEHTSTLVFVNARRLSERLATQLNELAAEHAVDGDTPEPPSVLEDVVKAHHGSLSRDRRLQIEDELKSGRIKGLVCTSSLELGIDMGAVDLVVQVESPRSVASGLQRIGRAGHQVGVPSRGKIFPKHRSDLVEATVVVQRMQDGLIESTRYPRNTLDVLAQHIVAMCAMDDWSVPELATVVRRSATFAELSDEVLTAVLDMLAGRYPSEAFSELRPRIVWERVDDVVRGRAGAQRLAVTSGGTIPDRGLYGVFLPDGTRVGELDEEMVYESRPGETFLLGATTWRIEDITHERVVVTPAPGEPGKMPFWHGDGPGRPYELGQGLGQFLREIRTSDAIDVLRDRHGLDTLAATNLLQYLEDQVEATGVVPDDRTIVVERFRDEIGDWRVCILSPFGAQVHAPWGIALRGRLAERYGSDIELMWSDDGIVLRLPEALDQLPLEDLVIDPAEIDEAVLAELPNTAMFAARFRECAARALLLPRRRPGQRTPLWQQRQRAGDLLTVAAAYDDFPILLETTRECLNDVFDLPGLRALLTDIAGRVVRVVPVDTPKASPFAQSLLFGWIAVYMYEGDAPLAERRAAALALDRDLLRDLLGNEELRELIDPGSLADLELELQRLTDGRRARDTDEVHDLLRVLGPLSVLDVEARTTADVDVVASLDALSETRRAIRVPMGGTERWAAAEDAARLRDAVGVALPPGLPAAFTDPVDHPLSDLVARYARTHGPFLTRDVAAWLAVPADRVAPVLDQLRDEGRITRGEFRPGGVEREWCDEEVLRTLRRRSLAVLRKEVEPVEPSTFARFLPSWQGVATGRRGPDAVADAVSILQGAALVASTLESGPLSARADEYRPADLDELCATGEVVWVGAGAIGSTDGRVRLFFRDQVAQLLLPPEGEPPSDPLHAALLGHLGGAGASFWPDLVAACAAADIRAEEGAVLAALWDLVWAGLVTNDSLAPVRAFTAGRQRTAATKTRRGRPRPGRLTRVGPPSAAGRWSLVDGLVPEPVADTTRRHATALQLLERHGVVTHEGVLAEELPGGYAAVYPVLKALEEQGRVRRGYFVAGLGAAQFALPGAVDRLRSERPDGRATSSADRHGPPLVLAATDPAQPFGAALPWPDTSGRPARASGASVVLHDGNPLVYLERGGRSLATFPAPAPEAEHDPPVVGWPQQVGDLIRSGEIAGLEIVKIDGEPAADSPHAQALLDAGFTRGYRGFVLRAPRHARG